jgi:hypothetical protein
MDGFADHGTECFAYNQVQIEKKFAPVSILMGAWVLPGNDEPTRTGVHGPLYQAK